MAESSTQAPVEVLLVEDNPGDIRLTGIALERSKTNVHLNVVTDGEKALAFLYKKDPYFQAPTPNLILLDLNLPKMDGREVLSAIKADPALKKIPVVVLTTSKADEDVARSYALHANCFITKPVDLDQFIKVIDSIEDFWFTIVKLPHVNSQNNNL